MGLKLIDAVCKSALHARLRPIAFLYARMANDDGSRCYPGVKWLAEALDRKECIVRRQRKELIELGVLEAETVYLGKRVHLKVVAFHSECLPPRRYKGTADGPPPRYGRTAERYRHTASVPEDGTGVPLSGTGVPPTSISTSKKNGTSQKLAAIAGARGAHTDPAIARVLSAFSQQYVEKFDRTPLIVRGKAGELVKQLLATWGEDEVLRLVGVLFSTTDARIRACDYTVGALFKFASHLALDGLRIVDPVTAHNFDAAARAMQPNRRLQEVDR